MVSEKQYIEREIGNEDKIYLYRQQGGVWKAYNASAERLYMIYPNLLCKKVMSGESSIRIILIDPMSVKALLAKYNVVQQTESELIIQLLPQ